MSLQLAHRVARTFAGALLMFVSAAALAVPPTVTVDQAASQVDPTSTAPIVFTIVFSQPVTGLTPADFSSAGTTAGGVLTLDLAGSGTTYTASISGMTTAGDVVLSLPVGAAQNAGAENNLASTSTDNTVRWQPPPPPSVTVDQAASQADPTSTAPILFTIVFSQPVTGLTAADFSSAGTTAGGVLTLDLAGSGTTYTASIAGMTTAGDVVLSLPAGAAQNAMAVGNLASTSTDNTVRWLAPVAPTVTINQGASQADPTGAASIAFYVAFSMPVTGFTASDVDLSASTAGGPLSATVSGGPALYTVQVTGMTSGGSVVARIPAGAAQSSALLDNVASTSTDNTVTFAPVLVAPSDAAPIPTLSDNALIALAMMMLLATSVALRRR